MRRAGEVEADRLRIIGTLATADLWRIWHSTEHRATARDKRAHEVVGLALTQRGLLDPAQSPRR
jgi:hypothetical protein